MKTFKAFLLEYSDYKIGHTAPTNDGFCVPLYNLDGIYPQDIYSANGASYYGDSGPANRDIQSIGIIQSSHNKPNSKIKIFRAVPLVLSKVELIDKYNSECKFILKNGRIPKTADRFDLHRSDYYEYAKNKIEELETTNTNDTDVIEINDGDWVTINKSYAIEHGKSHLQNKYKILSKTVLAKQLYTNGDSIHEWAM